MPRPQFNGPTRAHHREFVLCQRGRAHGDGPSHTVHGDPHDFPPRPLGTLLPCPLIQDPHQHAHTGLRIGICLDRVCLPAHCAARPQSDVPATDVLHRETAQLGTSRAPHCPKLRRGHGRDRQHPGKQRLPRIPHSPVGGDPAPDGRTGRPRGRREPGARPVVHVARDLVEHVGGEVGETCAANRHLCLM